jgi:4-amino-4-deoxy-L-arabinose transferase-like glycosyltransferase
MRPVPRVSATLSIALIVLLAALVRVVFFVGLVSGDPQDDGIYYANAYGIYRNGPTYFERFRDRPSNSLANPLDQFHFRPLITYPIAANFKLFGPGEIQAVLWGFICSLATVWVVYRLGAAVHDRRLGLLAAGLCVFYPAEVINGTRVLSDVQVGLFFGLGLLLLIEARRRASAALYAAAGVAAAAAYLANGRGLIAVGVLVGCAALQAWRGHTSWRSPGLVCAGFLAIFGVEATIYYLRTGDPLLNYHIHAEAARFKYLYEPVETLRWWRLQLRFTNGQPLELIRTVFVSRDLPAPQFGLFFYLFLAAAIVSVWRRRNRLLLLVCAVVFAFLEFGPVGLAYDAQAGELQYSMIFKQPRFLLILTAPLMVIAADALLALWRRSHPVFVLVLAVLVLTSLNATVRTRNYYRGGLDDLRAVADFVAANHDLAFWSDYWAVERLRIYTGYKAQNLRLLDVSVQPEHLRGGCVILGGSRGVELIAEYVETTYPPFARHVVRTGEIPSGWRLVREVKGKPNAQRARDLRVLCVP